MASSPRRTPTENDEKLPNYLDCQSIETAEDTSGDEYQLTRQRAHTSAEFREIFPSPSTESQKESNNTTERIPEVSTSPETAVVKKKTMTRNIPLDEVNLVRLVLRPDGSVKGISFTYEDADLAVLGSCEAEPDRWHVFFRPRYLLFTPAPGHRVGRGFFPIEGISFAEVIDGPQTESKAIEMHGSVMLHLSPSGLEMDVGGQTVDSPTVQHIEVPYRTVHLLEMVVAQPTTMPEARQATPESPSVMHILEAALDRLLGPVSKSEEQEGEEKPAPEDEQTAPELEQTTPESEHSASEAKQTAPEPESRAANFATNVRCRKRVLEQVRKALKGWCGMRSVLARLSMRVRKIGSKQNQ